MIQQAEEARIRRAHMLREIVEVLVLVGVIYLAISLSLAAYHVDGPSMQPNFQNGQLMAVNKLSYVFGTPQRGDVVVVSCYPLDPTNPEIHPGDGCVKRIIGVPHDTIAYTPDSVTVNGHLLNEPYIIHDTTNASGTAGKVTLGANQYWIMGDNRPVSRDSRYWGPVPRSYIVGKVFAVILPFPIHGVNTYSDTFKGV